MERKEPQNQERKRKRRSRKTLTLKTSPSGDIGVAINPAMAARFKEFADVSSKFAREVVERSGGNLTTATADHARLNIRIARTIFGKWSVEILTFLYMPQGARFQEIKKALGDISARVLSVKLSRLESLGLVHRAVLDTRPPGVEYSLTEKGREVAKLGEPVFLYLRLTEGLLGPVSP